MSANHAVDPTEILANAGPTMSVSEVGQVLGISRDTAYRLADRDELVISLASGHCPQCGGNPPAGFICGICASGEGA